MTSPRLIIGLLIAALVLSVSAAAYAETRPVQYLPNVSTERYAGPHVIRLNPPAGLRIIGGADVSSIRLSDGSICWAASMSYPDRSFRVNVYRQATPNSVGVEVPLPYTVQGHGTLSRDLDGVVLTLGGNEEAVRVYVEGCN